MYRSLALIMTFLLTACGTRTDLAPVESITQSPQDESFVAHPIVLDLPPTQQTVASKPKSVQKVQQTNQKTVAIAAVRDPLATPDGMTRSPVSSPLANPTKPKPLHLKSRTNTWASPLENAVVISGYTSETEGMVLTASTSVVLAASDGIVVYCGVDIKGNGNLVIIKHANDYMTAYSNVNEMIVKENDVIKKGQALAKLNTGNLKLYFEIRQSGTPLNPEKFYIIQ